MQPKVLHSPSVLFSAVLWEILGEHFQMLPGELMRADIQGQLGQYFKGAKTDLENVKLHFSEYLTWSFAERCSFWGFDSSEKYFAEEERYALIFVSSFKSPSSCVPGIVLVIKIYSGYVDF